MELSADKSFSLKTLLTVFDVRVVMVLVRHMLPP
jgi:hypothetical protein